MNGIVQNAAPSPELRGMELGVLAFFFVRKNDESDDGGPGGHGGGTVTTPPGTGVISSRVRFSMVRVAVGFRIPLISEIH